MAKIEEIRDDEAESIENIDELVDHSGVRQKLQQQPEPEVLEIGEVFGAVLHIIPFSFLYLLMDLLVSAQYNSWPTFTQEAKQMAKAVPLITVIIFYSNKYANSRWMQYVYLLSSIALGMSLIKLINDSPSYQVIKRAPSIAMLWVYAVVQAKLSFAVLSCVVIAVWVKYTDEVILF
ncbi:hypothetical protein E3P77_00363 [Wallemia ichthyophaga]|nr:hypothetical protein E3P91_00466 [Wallemia ichthyophaga]TIA93528.1 hypothetical protein E3P97_00884 [Wallemia ichthyophaga]TIB00703.1 hypothetical protein E3P95_01597 [Wallemia ichthyophaga]TIB01051.1 hypothetical protein E3P94_01983 [Wallemia ichthyophaga]TIB25731.1 hypothetical protein E3P89_00321 [Wallemia ichthyophaga]